MTKRARPHFRVAEFADGQPWIVMEFFDGDRLSLFQKSIGFDLSRDISYEEAESVREFLSRNLVTVNEG
jgi:hypothetical protein